MKIFSSEILGDTNFGTNKQSCHHKINKSLRWFPKHILQEIQRDCKVQSINYNAVSFHFGPVTTSHNIQFLIISNISSSSWKSNHKPFAEEKRYSRAQLNQT